MHHLQGDQARLYTAKTSGASLAIMLEHLIDFDPPAAALTDVRPVETTSPEELVAAQLSTAKWLEQMGAPSAEEAAAANAQILAQDAFKNLTTVADNPKQRAAVLALKTPPAVRHLTGMLTAYDWAFVEQAHELRGYAVAQILEETKHPDARIRLRALELLGRVTEVALFTDRMEIKKTEMPDHELDAKIKEKLNRFMGVLDTEVVEIASKSVDTAAN